MNRRNALKKLGLGSGIVFATPALISFLQSCNDETNTWQPIFLTLEESNILKAITDVIIPKTDTPSASEVNVPQFIDKYLDEVTELEDQKNIKEAFQKLISIIKSDYNENINKVSEDQYKLLLDKHMLLKEPQREKNQPMSISNLLNTIKWMTINAYLITEHIGENVLAYDPIPGYQKGCITVNEATGGKAWSL
ncbi:gluconate 2-dehydrogenase subunit 3 family protein [uncultured Wocania sp.]|uniref:gluconate 2-dehydrogenase subunit 3 family protein n=1 Tax=uncultured Wocania sp. TaxID=2834404 RepID=UPI0030F6F2D6